MTSVKKNQVLATSQVFKATRFRLNPHESLLPAPEMKEIHVELCGKSRIKPNEIELLALQICINYLLMVQTRIVYTHADNIGLLSINLITQHVCQLNMLVMEEN